MAELPYSLRPKKFQWWHIASLLGTTRRLVRRAARSRLLAPLDRRERCLFTLSGTITHQENSGEIFSVELIHYDLCLAWGLFRTWHYRSSHGPGGDPTEHPMYDHVLEWMMGRYNWEYWGAFAIAARRQAFGHYSQFKENN